MGPTLALLLLLLLPPPSLSLDNATEKVVPVAGQPEVKTTTVSVYQHDQDPPTIMATTNMVLTKNTIGNPETLTTSPTQTTAAPSPKEAMVPGQTPGPATTSLPGSADGQSGDDSGLPTNPSGSQGDKMNTGRPPSDADPTSSTEQPVPSGGKSSDNVTTAPPATQGSDQITTPSSQTPDPLAAAKSPPASTTVSTASPHSPSATPSQTTEDHSTVVLNTSSGPVVSPSDLSVSPGKPTMHAPLGSSKGTLPTTIQMPGVSTSPVSTPWQTTGSTVETETLPTDEEFVQSSSHWTPTAPQGPSTSSPGWTSRNYKLKCEAPMMPSEELLILNLTGASLCEGNSADEKLVEMLCHSVKASFKPAQDQCTLQLAPILGSRAVAVKRVTIETKLPPKVVYELLKDKWDDLREAGVSDMMLGSEGPPETNEDRFSLPLIITIVCMASFLLLVAALYGCCHQRISQRKDQQRLTEELQTVENGYHDNPTLEVMETPSEMQEKKVVNLNGELGDSWIVPLDNLTKDDLDEEEDTHL